MMRPLGYLSPTVRNTRHAAAQLLAGPATPGPWGALVDLKRLMLASRVTGTAVIGLVVAVDPAVALLVQAVCSYLSAANTGYCSTQARRAGARATSPAQPWAAVCSPVQPCAAVQSGSSVLMRLPAPDALPLPPSTLRRRRPAAPADDGRAAHQGPAGSVVQCHGPAVSAGEALALKSAADLKGPVATTSDCSTKAGCRHSSRCFCSSALPARGGALRAPLRGAWPAPRPHARQRRSAPAACI